MPYDEGGIMEIARRSRGTPRIANRLLKRVRDFAQVRADGHITAEVARDSLNMQDVDALGLDRIDRAVLSAMTDKFGGGPVGLDTLAAVTGEDAVTIEDVYEPYLMQLGFIMRTPVAGSARRWHTNIWAKRPLPIITRKCSRMWSRPACWNRRKNDSLGSIFRFGHP
ncbi:MAG: hypothetical protein IJJ60_14290, partial [Clostridia bacterium]|nr:hypothetical protein [Clostridia bacterium]